MKRVYLAGKIEPNGWRQRIFDMRNTFVDYEKYDFKNILYKCDNKFYITGPFFLSCDHSCYHGEQSHGLGLKSEGCNLSGMYSFKENEVIDICKTQINDSDIVFAYINSNTCYGSIWEIAYAKTIGKKVYVVFDTEKRKRDMWFVSGNADFSISLDMFSILPTLQIHNKEDFDIVYHLIHKLIR